MEIVSPTVGGVGSGIIAQQDNPIDKQGLELSTSLFGAEIQLSGFDLSVSCWIAF